MKKLFILLAFLSSIFYSSTYAQSPTMPTSQQIELNQKMTYYYMHPNVGDLLWIFNKSFEEHLYEETNGAGNIVLMFLSEAIKNQPESTEEICQKFSHIQNQQKGHFAWIIHNARSADSEPCLRKLLGITNNLTIQPFLSAAIIEPLSKPVTSPQSLDFLWAVFFATGNPDAVNKIIDVMLKPSPEPTAPNAIIDTAMQYAARWSLSSNKKQHPKVFEIVQNRLDKTVDPSTQRQLKNVLLATEQSIRADRMLMLVELQSIKQAQGIK